MSTLFGLLSGGKSLAGSVSDNSHSRAPTNNAPRPLSSAIQGTSGYALPGNSDSKSEWSRDSYCLKDYLTAQPADRNAADATISSGSISLSAPGLSLTSADIGKLVYVEGAGSGNVKVLRALIIDVDRHIAKLSAPASTGVSGSKVSLVSDSFLALRAAIIDAMNERKALSAAQGKLTGVLAVGPGPIRIDGGSVLTVTNELHLSPGLSIYGQQRYAGTPVRFDPNSTAKSLFHLHLGNTFPPPDQGYPDLTDVPRYAEGGFVFSDLSIEIFLNNPENHDCSIFFGNPYVVDGQVRSCWFNALGDGNVNEAYESSNPDAAFGLSVWRGSFSGIDFGGNWIEGFSYVFDLTHIGDSNVHDNYFDQGKGVIRGTGSVRNASIHDNKFQFLGGPNTQVPRFLVDWNDNTGSSSQWIQGFSISDNIIEAAVAASATARLDSIAQGLFRLVSDNVYAVHTTKGNVCFCAGTNYGTSPNDPQNGVNRIGAWILSGDANVTSENDTFVLIPYRFMDGEVVAYHIDRMANDESVVVIDGAKISARGFEAAGPGWSDKARTGIYIGGKNAAGTIIIKDCVFLGEITHCIFIDSGANCRIIVENPVVSIQTYLKGSISLEQALFPNGKTGKTRLRSAHDPSDHQQK